MGGQSSYSDSSFLQLHFHPYVICSQCSQRHPILTNCVIDVRLIPTMGTFVWWLFQMIHNDQTLEFTKNQHAISRNGKGVSIQSSLPNSDAFSVWIFRNGWESQCSWTDSLVGECGPATPQVLAQQGMVRSSRVLSTKNHLGSPHEFIHFLHFALSHRISDSRKPWFGMGNSLKLLIFPGFPAS